MMNNQGEIKTQVRLVLGSSFVLHTGEVIDIVEDNFVSWNMKATSAGFVGRERKYGMNFSYYANGRIAGGARNKNGNCMRDVRVSYPWYRATRQLLAHWVFQVSNKLTRKMDKVRSQRRAY